MGDDDRVVRFPTVEERLKKSNQKSASDVVSFLTDVNHQVFDFAHANISQFMPKAHKREDVSAEGMTMFWTFVLLHTLTSCVYDTLLAREETKSLVLDYEDNRSESERKGD